MYVYLCIAIEKKYHQSEKLFTAKLSQVDYIMIRSKVLITKHKRVKISNALLHKNG